MTSSSSSTSYLDRLVAFYRFYAPDRVSSAQLTLQSYESREDLMFRALEKKYGPEQAAIEHERKTNSISNKAKSETNNINNQAKKSSSFIPPPPPPPLATILALHMDPIRSRVERFYQHYAPDKLVNIDAALDSYRGREEIMLQILEKKYGPEPRAFVVVTPRSAALKRASNATTLKDESSSSPSATRRRSTAHFLDEEDDCLIVDAKIAGPSAGPDPKSIKVHTPYDYDEVLYAAGVRGHTRVAQEVEPFGEDKRPYGVALTLLIALIGEEVLFDPDRPLVFPFHALKELKGTFPDAVDAIAFEHLLAYRSVFASMLQHTMYIRHLEVAERQCLVQAQLENIHEISHHVRVLGEAVKQLQPMEEERRSMMLRDERLRFDGLILWFRKRRLDIVHGVPLLEHSADDYYGVVDGGDGHLRSILSESYHSPNVREGGAGGGSPARVRLEDSERKLKQIHEALRSKANQIVVTKWDTTAAPSIREHTTAAPSPLTNSRRFSAKKVVSSSEDVLTSPSRLPAGANGISKGIAQHSRSPSRLTPDSPSFGPNATQQHAWVPAGCLDTHNIVGASKGSIDTTTHNGEAGGATPTLVVVREHLHFDPFSRDDTMRSRTPSRTPSTTSTAFRSPSSSAVSCEVDRTVRLRKLAGKGSFSSMRHCAATDAKRYFAPGAAAE